MRTGWVPRSASPLVLLMSLVILLAGCTSTGDRFPRPTPPANPATQDKDIRPVRMTSGRALTHVLPETAGQILCQALSKDRWEQLLGGPVGRHPGSSECTISSDRVGLKVSLAELGGALRAQTAIGGRPAAPFAGAPRVVGFTVALTDDALRPPRPQAPWARPQLQLVGMSTHELGFEGQRDVALRVLNELVPLLSKEGDPLPDIDDEGRIRYVETPSAPGGQIVDVPRPVQALQLCTIMHRVATEFELTGYGRCRASTNDGGQVELKLSDGDAVANYPDRIAGRPARQLEHPPNALGVLLRDDVSIDLTVSAPNPAALAENIVPLLLA